MPTYQELVAQKENLVAQINDIDARLRDRRKTEVSEAAAEVKRLVGEYGLSAVDCGFVSKPKKAGCKVPVKYRGPNGEAWTGRGRPPAWIVAAEAAGRPRAEFLIQ